MLGTINRVIKNANAKPKMIVQDNGPQNTTLSPPKKMFGLKCWNKVTQLILNPTASGNRPRIVANAVSMTGMIRIFPACTAASRMRMPRLRSSSVKSISRIAFFTTIPANPTMPTITIIKGIDIPVIAKPRKTPIILKKISVNTINGLLRESNCNTRIPKINPRAMTNAVPKNPSDSCCSSC